MACTSPQGFSPIPLFDYHMGFEPIIFQRVPLAFTPNKLHGNNYNKLSSAKY